MILKLWGNGETDYFLNTETGEVRRESNFPCSTPGKDFLKNIHRESSLGVLGKEDVEYVLDKISQAKSEGYEPHPGYDGWGSDLYPFWDSELALSLSPGKKRTTL